MEGEKDGEREREGEREKEKGRKTGTVLWDSSFCEPKSLQKKAFTRHRTCFTVRWYSIENRIKNKDHKESTFESVKKEDKKTWKKSPVIRFKSKQFVLLVNYVYTLHRYMYTVNNRVKFIVHQSKYFFSHSVIECYLFFTPVIPWQFSHRLVLVCSNHTTEKLLIVSI